MNEDITPVEAGLKWTIGARRRDACDFLGGEVCNVACESPSCWRVKNAAAASQQCCRSHARDAAMLADKRICYPAVH